VKIPNVISFRCFYLLSSIKLGTYLQTEFCLPIKSVEFIELTLAKRTDPLLTFEDFTQKMKRYKVFISLFFWLSSPINSALFKIILIETH
jgi:hypothetical protein